jgi:hypothetical protein
MSRTTKIFLHSLRRARVARGEIDQKTPNQRQVIRARWRHEREIFARATDRAG